MRRICRLSRVAVCGGIFLQVTWSMAGELDENKVRQAVLQRFDENRNDKLEASEARQARERLRNLLEDTSGREINIATWRDDVRELLQCMDQDGDNRLSASEKDSAAAILEHIIPKVDTSRPKDSERSVSSSRGGLTLGTDQDRKRRSSGSYGGGGARYGMSLGGGGFGLGNASAWGNNGASLRGFGSPFGGIGSGGVASGFGSTGTGGFSGGASAGTASASMSGLEAGQSGSGTGMPGVSGTGNPMTDGAGMSTGMGALRPGVGDPGMRAQPGMSGTKPEGSGASGMTPSGPGNFGIANAGQSQSPLAGANDSHSMSLPLEDIPLEDSALGGSPGMPTSPMGSDMPGGGLSSAGMPPTEGLGGLGTPNSGGSSSSGPEFIPPPAKPNF